MKFDLNAPNPIAPFRRIPNGKILEKIILARLPKSANTSFNNPDSGIEWHTLHGYISPHSWIVATCYREDMGNEYSISSPPDAEITEDLKESFRSSKLFDWNNKYLLVGIDNEVSQLFYEISVLEKGNTTLVVPCVALTMEDENVEAFCNEQGVNPEVTIRPIQDKAGIDFLAGGWSATKDGTLDHLAKLLNQRGSLSTGIYVNNEIVSGIVLKSHGALGMLYTSPNHRNKGYAKAAYKAIIAELKNRQLIPCLHIALNNESSKLFHDKLGFKITHRVDYFEFDGLH